MISRPIVALALSCTLCAYSQEAAPPPAPALPPIGTAESNDAFTLVAKIPVPNMTGTWDHLTLDATGKRLFASAQEDNEVRVFDLAARQPLHTIAGGFARPQGLYYVPGTDTLAVTNGKDGTLRSFNGRTYKPIKILPLSLGADMMDMDPKTKYLYVDHGGVDSNRGPGALAIVDTKTWEKAGEVPTEYRPGSLEVEQHGNRLFVLLPGLSQIGVVDRTKQQIVARYQLDKPAQPIALTLDEPGKLIFVAERRPSSFHVLDLNTGANLATLDVIDGVESIYFDARLHRIYMTALDGFVQVIQQFDRDHYTTIARFFTGHHAGTSQFVPGMNLFCVAVPPVEGQTAAIWLFEPKLSTAPPSEALLDPYQPQPIPDGVIRSWGHVFLKKVMLSWETGFQKYHPNVTFSDNLVSSAAATGALFTDTADLGIVGREIRPLEVAGYTRVKKHKPFPFEVMTGSFANADKSVALGIFVAKDNPIQHLTYAQLDAIFGSEHLGGASANIRTWGQLGLTGNWTARPIHIYIGELDAAPAFFFSQQVMHGSILWNDGLQHFDDLTRPDGTTYEAQQRILDALAKDPNGIALSGAGTRNPNTRVVPISITDTDHFILPTPATVESRAYPLSRSVWIYTNQADNQPLSPRAREFLRYIFSREGQQAVHDEGEYLPLTPAMARAQLARLQ
jgi:phosphate transport system substrate-binding protein